MHATAVMIGDDAVVLMVGLGRRRFLQPSCPTAVDRDGLSGNPVAGPGA